MNKEVLRKKGLEIRRGLSEKVRFEKSEKILKKLEEHEWFKAAKHVLFYYELSNEVNVSPLIEKYSELKTIYLPKVVSETHFEIIPLSKETEMKKGAYKINEPRGEASSINPDLIIIPGVAFDKEGNRLGMGKGYYDRYLKKVRSVKKIGLAFEEQMLESIPKEPYDIPVDIIITDQTIY